MGSNSSSEAYKRLVEEQRRQSALRAEQRRRQRELERERQLQEIIERQRNRKYRGGQ